MSVLAQLQIKIKHAPEEAIPFGVKFYILSLIEVLKKMPEKPTKFLNQVEHADYVALMNKKGN